MNNSSEYERALQNMGFSCLLLAARDLVALAVTQLSYICLEGGHSLDPHYGLKMLITKFGPLIWLIEV